MAANKLDILKENEREVLRLLLRGFDAKAAANEIDVTPNVVNERLRSARRKLEVTSSKQAARILAESENIGPNIFVNKEIGIVSTSENDRINPLPDTRASALNRNRVRETQAAYQSFAFLQNSLQSVPFRKQGEQGNDLGKNERLAAIGELTIKLASAFAFICLAALLISTIITRI